MSTTGRRIFLQPPFVGEAERASVAAAFDSGYIAPCGPQVEAFERALASLSGRRYAVALSSGTAAIDLVLECLGVGPGWTVVSPTLSFIATVGSAWHRGAELALVDCDATGNLDVALLDRALAELTAAGRRKLLVFGVDLFGTCCDYAALRRICRRHGAVFAVDAAESVGSSADGRAAGSAGVAAVYSFNGNKVVTTGGGGAIVTDSRRLAALALKLSQQGREPKPQYEFRMVGYNYRMSNVLAAIGLAQLARLPEILARKRKVRAFYAQLAASRSGFSLLDADGASNCWLNVMRCPSRRTRDRLVAAFAAADVEARPAWKPLHLQPVFRQVKTFGGAQSEAIFRTGLCLPSGAGLSAADLGRIAAVFASADGAGER